MNLRTTVTITGTSLLLALFLALPAFAQGASDQRVEHIYTVPLEVVVDISEAVTVTDRMTVQIQLAVRSEIVLSDTEISSHALLVKAESDDADVTVGSPEFVETPAGDPASAEQETQAADATTEEANDATTGMATRNANLRDGPGTNFPIVGSVRAGQKLGVDGVTSTGDWYLLESGAWIASFLVNDVRNVSTLEPSAIPTPEPTPASAVAAPAPSPAIVLIPQDGTQLTLGDGTQIRHPIVDAVPVPTDNDWVRVVSGSPVFGISGDASGLAMDITLSFLVKQGVPTEIIVDDVTLAPFRTVIRDTAPGLDSDVWTGASASSEVNRANTPWLYDDGTSYLTYRITMRTEGGEEIVFFQTASFEDAGKVVVRDILEGQ